MTVSGPVSVWSTRSAPLQWAEPVTASLATSSTQASAFRVSLTWTRGSYCLVA